MYIATKLLSDTNRWAVWGFHSRWIAVFLLSSGNFGFLWNRYIRNFFKLTFSFIEVKIRFRLYSCSYKGFVFFPNYQVLFAHETRFVQICNFWGSLFFFFFIWRIRMEDTFEKGIEKDIFGICRFEKSEAEISGFFALLWEQLNKNFCYGFLHILPISTKFYLHLLFQLYCLLNWFLLKVFNHLESFIPSYRFFFFFLL